VTADAVLDLVTIVYRREIPFLRLQARSIARFLDPEGIGGIVVIVNDIDEPGCAAAVEALRADYGRLAERLKVLRPGTVFAARPAENGPQGPRQRFRLWFARHRRLYPFGVKRGWRGNRGWSVQQALKLAAARHGDSRFVLMLDAKNHFVRPVGLASFVSPRGKPLTYLQPPSAKFHRWIVGSFRLLGAEPPGPDAPAPPTITPVCVPRAVLRDCLDAVERRVGPVEAFFARARAEESEFMLIYAYVAGFCGGWDAVFDPGLNPAATIFRRSDAATVDRELARVEAGTADILSIHSSRIASLTAAERRRIAAIWRDRGLGDPGLFPDP
jgi:hypothetical protein